MRKIIRSYDMGGWQFDVYDDGSQIFRYIGDGKMKVEEKHMDTKEKLLNRIASMRSSNDYYATAVVTNDTVRNQIKVNNALLNDLFTYISTEKDANAEYERGLNDAWNLARKIGGVINHGAYDCEELKIIFDEYEIYDVFDKFSYQEAIAKVQEYEKKKAEEEAKKLVPGDVIKLESKYYSNGYTGIYLSSDEYSVRILTEPDYVVRVIGKNEYIIKKTGKHIDLSL